MYTGLSLYAYIHTYMHTAPSTRSCNAGTHLYVRTPSIQRRLCVYTEI